MEELAGSFRVEGRATYAHEWRGFSLGRAPWYSYLRAIAFFHFRNRLELAKQPKRYRPSEGDLGFVGPVFYLVTSCEAPGMNETLGYYSWDLGPYGIGDLIDSLLRYGS